MFIIRYYDAKFIGGLQFRYIYFINFMFVSDCNLLLLPASNL